MSQRGRSSTPELLRVQYADGARLRSKDLRTIGDDASARLGLHVVAPHGTWGVASGLRVNVAEDGRGATVSTGAAFNCRGRALLLGGPAQLDTPGPSLAGRLLEAVIGPAPQEGDCESAPAVVRWAPVGGSVDVPESIRLCGRQPEDVVLGRFRVGKTGELLAAHPAGRSVAQTRAWARSGHGVVTLGSLDWAPRSGGWVATVDTSAARFSATPAYVVSVPDLLTDGQNIPVLQLIPGSGTPSKTSFRVGLRWGTRAGAQPIAPRSLADLKLHWTGVQSLEGCPLFFGPRVVLPLGVSTIMGGFLSV